MAVERLVKEIQKLSAKQKEELLRKLGFIPDTPKEKLRGGKDDPLAKIIGIGEGPENGSTTYKEDLYGNKHL